MLGRHIAVTVDLFSGSEKIRQELKTTQVGGVVDNGTIIIRHASREHHAHKVLELSEGVEEKVFRYPIVVGKLVAIWLALVTLMRGLQTVRRKDSNKTDVGIQGGFFSVHQQNYSVMDEKAGSGEVTFGLAVVRNTKRLIILYKRYYP